MRKSIFLVTILILVTIFFVLVKPSTGDRDKFETYKLPIKIGDHAFLFQRNYVWKYKQEGTNSDFVNLQVLLPNFEPITKENHAKFLQNEPTINLTISSNSVSNVAPSDKFQPDFPKRFEELARFYCGSDMDLLDNAGTTNVQTYSCGSDRKLITTKSKDFLIICDSGKHWPNPQCQNIGNMFNLFGNLNFSFHFDEKYSSKSVEIYKFVERLIENAKSEGER